MRLSIRGFTLIEMVTSLAIAAVVIGGALVFTGALATRLLRIQTMGREETQHEAAAREVSDAIKRATEVAIYADGAARDGDTRSVRGTVLGLRTEGGDWTYFEFVPGVTVAGTLDSSSASEEIGLRTNRNIGRLVQTIPGIGTRVLLEFCARPSALGSGDWIFDLDLGAPRTRWEMQVVRLQGRPLLMQRAEFSVVAAGLRMR